MEMIYSVDFYNLQEIFWGCTRNHTRRNHLRLHKQSLKIGNETCQGEDGENAASESQDDPAAIILTHNYAQDFINR